MCDFKPCCVDSPARKTKISVGIEQIEKVLFQNEVDGYPNDNGMNKMMLHHIILLQFGIISRTILDGSGSVELSNAKAHRDLRI